VVLVLEVSTSHSEKYWLIKYRNAQRSARIFPLFLQLERFTIAFGDEGGFVGAGVLAIFEILAAFAALDGVDF
jgi:hypothetical protein